ncbi:hypothetical protein DM01DRAFT_1331455 [Hesseltinella vesiculosa]|uniref:Uncharacterized protein n=1 Tax=Hesseltinella vesiculosa TaxID=101127 RepID=A0A1X2GVC2_9FUNG|nr:hypothetical protein DM01DRAFT_1331455 [Hesseltinella vesiculosa]
MVMRRPLRPKENSFLLLLYLLISANHVMDWDLLEATIAHCDKIIWADRSSQLLDAFESLLQLLKGCQTVQECASRYPKAGHILTKASLHPYIGYDRKVCQLLIDCILEYAKYDCTPSMNAPPATLEKTMLWCIRRLQQISHCATVNHGSMTETMMTNQVTRFKARLEQQLAQGMLTAKRLELLSNQLPLLWTDQRLGQLVEALANVSLRWHAQQRRDDLDDTGHVTSTSCFSDKFIARLLKDTMDQDEGQRGARGESSRWSLAAKCSTWLAIPQVFEWEWLASMGDGLDERQEHSQPRPMTQAIQSCAPLFYQSLCTLATWLDKGLFDWRMVRRWIMTASADIIDFAHPDFQKSLPLDLVAMVEQLSRLNIAPERLADPRTRMDQWTLLESTVSSFIYGGSMETIHTRRDQAWLMCFLFQDCLAQCARACLYFCQSLITWEQLLPITKFIAWLIYPTMDPLLGDSTLLMAWLSSLKDYHQVTVPDASERFLSHGRLVIRLNVYVGIEFLVSMMETSTWTKDDCDTLIHHVLQDHESHDMPSHEPRTSIQYLLIPLLDRLTHSTDDRLRSLIPTVKTMSN